MFKAESPGFGKTPRGIMFRGESGEEAGDLSSFDDDDSTVDTVVVGEEFVDEAADVEDRLSFL